MHVRTMGKISHTLASFFFVFSTLLFIPTPTKAEDPQGLTLYGRVHGGVPLEHETGMPGELIDIRKGSLSWETLDLSLSGNGGLDINIYRKFMSNVRAERVMEDWDISLPRITMNTNPTGTTKFETYGVDTSSNPGICADDNYNANINAVNFNLAFTFAGMVDYFNLDEESPFITGIFLNLMILAFSTDVPVADTYTGLQLSIPGEGTKNLLRNRNQVVMGENLQRFTSGRGLNARYVTTDNWLVDCAPDASGKLNNFVAYSPDGKTYTFNKRSKAMGDPMFMQQTGQNVWYPSRIEDAHGNSLSYKYLSENYLCLGWQEYIAWYAGTIQISPRIAPVCPNTFKVSEITASDGRKVTFNYERPSEGIPKENRTLHDHSGRRIESIEAHGRVWKYRYEEWRPGFSNYLSEVELPDGTTWKYEKFDTNNGGIPFMSNDWARNFLYSRWTGVLSFEPDSMVGYMPDGTRTGPGIVNTVIGLMKSVTTPLGLKIDYTYDAHNANYFEDTTSKLNQVYSIENRTVSGPGIETVTRSYSYGKNGSLNQGYTDITYPETSDGSTPIKKYTFNLRQGSDHFGLPIQEEIYNNDILVQKRELEYETLGTIDLPSRIKESPRANNVLRAQKRITVTNQDGNQYTTVFEDFDAYGRPTRIIESGSPYMSYIDSDTGISVQPTRVKTVSYFNNYDDWILGKTEDVTVQDNGGGSGDVTIDREYYSNGLLRSITQNLGTQSFQYYSNGNLRSKSWRVSGIQHSTNYSDYYRGIARREEKPNSIILKRGVNDWGEITDFTNGRNVTITFQRDDMGRVERVEHPDFSGSITEWNYNENPRRKRITEGNVQTDIELNALGRETSIAITDLLTSETTYQTMEYDSYSQLIFESNKSFSSNPITGVSFQYDVLGRKVYSEDQRNNIIRTCYGLTCLPNGMPYSGWDLNGYIVQVETIELPAGGDESGSLSQNIQNITISTAYGDPSESSINGIFIKESESFEADRYSATLYARTLAGDPIQISKGGGTISSRATRTYEYYPNSNLIHYDNSPDLGVTELFYDESGNIRQKTIGDDITVRYRYNHENKILYEDYPNTNGTPDVSYDYDRNGNLRWIDNGYVRMTYQYNTADLLEDVTYFLSGETFYIDYEWNQDRTLEALTYPDSERITYRPNGYGLPTTVGSYAINAAYHPTKHLESFEYGNGVLYKAELNDYNVPSSYEITNGSNTLIAQEMYQHNFRKQIYSVAKQIGVGASRFTETYRYTPSNYLKSGVNELGAVDYSYDLLGNIERKQEAGEIVTMNYSGLSSGSRGTRITTASTSSGNNYSFDHDLLGNIINNGRNSFVYDNASRLSSVSDLGIQYYYDGRGHRIVEMLPDQTKITLRSDKGQIIYQHNVESRLAYKYYGLGSMLVAENEVPCSINCDISLVMQPRISDADRTLESSDLAISEPRAEVINDNLNYSYEVTNLGQDRAENVVFIHRLPEGKIDSYTISAGTCELIESELRCNIGGLSQGQIVTFNAVATGISLQRYEDLSFARVTSTTFDPDPSNNSVVRSTPGGQSCQTEAAAQGTFAENRLDVIRSYRDDVLTNSIVGPRIIAAYYDSSAFWLEQMENNSWSLYVMRLNVAAMLLISYIGLAPENLFCLMLILLLSYIYIPKIYNVDLRKES